MAHNDDTPKYGQGSRSDSAQDRIPLRNKGRKFFQQMQPTFAVEVPNTVTRLQFLDENDPAKDQVVRKKAREWVNRNRKSKRHEHERRLATQDVESVTGSDQTQDSQKQLQRKPSSINFSISHPASSVGSANLDPFSILPDVGRDYRELVDFFFHGCPEEVPCSDDKYSQTPNKDLIGFNHENTVFSNMAKSDATFIMWLYSLAAVHGGMIGRPNSEEVRWFYNKALIAVQRMLKKDVEAGKYSDELLNGMTCATATASYSGMYDTATLHRSATIRALTIRGGGDIMEGLKSLPPWSCKAIQWSDMMTAVGLVETPHVPHYHAFPYVPLPYQGVREAERRTANTLSHLPPLSEPTQYIVSLLHQIDTAHADPNPPVKIDPYVIRLLYDAEFAILQLLEAQKLHGVLSDIEALLVETLHMYLWAGLRGVPTTLSNMADVLLDHILTALLPFLLKGASTDVKLSPGTTRKYASAFPVVPGSQPRTLSSSRPTNNVIAWCLAIATKVASKPKRPEHSWLKGHLRLHLQAMGLSRDEMAYRRLLNMFPTTDSFPYISLGKLLEDLDT